MPAQPATSRTCSRIPRGPAAIALPVLLFLLPVHGCTARAPAIDPVGTYTLQLVGGKSLPCEVQHEGSPLVKAGTFVIRADGTCTSRITLSVPQGPQDVAIEREATYTREGSTLTMSWKGFGVTKGTVEGAAFLMDNEGIVYEYRK